MAFKQNLPPPAFQEYASNMLADATFRAASLSARGLLYQLRLECWANVGRVPSDPHLLAKYLGISLDEFNSAYPEIERFFSQVDGHLRCPVLDDYRASLVEIRRKQSEGGKKGAIKTNTGKARDTCDSLDKTSSVQVSSSKIRLGNQERNPNVHKEWIDEFDAS